MKGKVTIPLADFKLMEAKWEELKRLWEATAKCFKTRCWNESCSKSDKGDKSCPVWEMEECGEAHLVTEVDAGRLVRETAAYMGHESYVAKNCGPGAEP